MKNHTGHIIFLILTILFLSSCSKEDIVIMPESETSNVNFQLNLPENASDGQNNASNAEFLSKASAANTQTNVLRGKAPMNINGIKMNVIHDNGDLDEKSKEFYFSGDTDSNSPGEAAEMLVYKGNNSFYAESMSSVKPKNKAYKNKIDLYDEYDFEREYLRNHWSYPSYDDMNNAKVKYYSEELAKIHPVYSHYSGTTEANIIGDNTPLDISMTTNSARFSIVLESYGDYYVTLVVKYQVDGETKRIRINKTAPYTVSAVVLNDTDITDSTLLTIKIILYRKNGNSNNYKIMGEPRYIYKNGLISYSSHSGETQYSPTSGVNETLVLSYDSNY